MATRFAAAFVVLALSLSGCGLLERELPEEIPNPDHGSGGTRALALVDWGVVDGLLSVHLRNTTERTLKRADALVTLRTASGASLRSGPSSEDDECCTLLDVPPGGDFGIYVDIGLAAETTEDVDEVEVTYEELAWSPPDATGEKPAPTLVVGRERLTTGDEGAEVVTRLTAKGGDVPAAAGQAFLVDRDGEFLAVVSGRFECFHEGRARKVVMELYHPVPDGTTVDLVVAYPIRSSPAMDGVDCPG